MTSDNGAPPAENETGRLEAFSDGVFSIAITLLGFDLMLPALEEPISNARLIDAELERWPTYVAFITSFASILIMWINHHTLFRFVGRADMGFKLANGLLLAVVTVVPVPTALIAEYLGTPAAAVAAATYAGVFFVSNLTYNLAWWVARSHGLLVADASAARVTAVSRSYLLGGPLYLVAAAVAFWNAYLCLAICFALWILWAFTGRPSAQD